MVVPKSVDFHPLRSFTVDQLHARQSAPPDEFGVTHHDIFLLEFSIRRLVTS